MLQSEFLIDDLLNESTDAPKVRTPIPSEKGTSSKFLMTFP